MVHTVSGASRNPVGRRFHRLVVVELSGRDRWKAALWRFKCDCGSEYVARLDQVRRGLIKSCGCLSAENTAKRCKERAFHGHSGAAQSSEYRTWRCMTARCDNIRNASYARYGGRGITVCDRWRGQKGFINFLADMGKKPSPRHTIGRIDPWKHYEPGNCRWENAKQQGRNRRDNRMVNYFGRLITIAEACELQNIKRNVVDARLHRGMTPEQAVLSPVKYHRPRQE